MMSSLKENDEFNFHVVRKGLQRSLSIPHIPHFSPFPSISRRTPFKTIKHQYPSTFSFNHWTGSLPPPPRPVPRIFSTYPSISSETPHRPSNIYVMVRTDMIKYFFPSKQGPQRLRQLLWPQARSTGQGERRARRRCMRIGGRLPQTPLLTLRNMVCKRRSDLLLLLL